MTNTVPMWMILNNYDTFYPGDTEGKISYAKQFFDVCEKGEVDAYNEVYDIADIRTRYGV